jgi:putative acyl-CoA dehydrogenase
MVQLTRLDCAIASAGLMRMALAQAIHHARYRTVFQKHLVDQPMMRAVLADMALEVEAATALTLRLARSFDLAAADPREAARARLLTPAVKYWVCKRAPSLIYEAMECLGGNGYVEESMLPRLYREAPVNAIWEGSGNVMCLDVLRALGHDRDPARMALAALAEEAADLPGARAALDVIARAAAAEDAEGEARAAVDRLALLAAAAALRQSAPEVANLFARTRLEESHGAMYGTSRIAADEARRLIDRALPPA